MSDAILLRCDGVASCGIILRVTTEDPLRAGLAGLDEEQRAWLLHARNLWARAHDIARTRPDLDAGDIYHALRCLELRPSERLARGLARGRLRAHAR
jgi:hypothetical protein